MLGLHEDDAEQVFRRVKRSYEGEGPTGAGGAVGEDGEDLGQSLIVRRCVLVFCVGVVGFVCGCVWGGGWWGGLDYYIP